MRVFIVVVVCRLLVAGCCEELLSRDLWGSLLYCNLVKLQNVNSFEKSGHMCTYLACSKVHFMKIMVSCWVDSGMDSSGPADLVFFKYDIKNFNANFLSFAFDESFCWYDWFYSISTKIGIRALVERCKKNWPDFGKLYVRVVFYGAQVCFCSNGN